MRKHVMLIFTKLTLILLLTGCGAQSDIPGETIRSTTPPQPEQPAPITTVPVETHPAPPVTVPCAPPATEAPVVTEPMADILPYIQQIDRNDQPIYSGPGYDSEYVRTVQKRGTYTIVEEAYDSDGNLWGRLKSGIGWVDLTDIRSGTGNSGNSVPCILNIDRNDQSVYGGPGYDYVFVGTIQEKGTYTIVEEATDPEGNLWGKLKSGMGWVDLTQMQSETYKNTLLSANYADENLLLHGAYHLYSSGQEYSISIAFRASGKLRDVTLYEMEPGAQGYNPGADLFTLQEMSPELPLVAELAFPGDMSMYGIRFLDEAGTTHVYRIYISLRNGALMLTEE